MTSVTPMAILPLYMLFNQFSESGIILICSTPCTYLYLFTVLRIWFANSIRNIKLMNSRLTSILTWKSRINFWFHTWSKWWYILIKWLCLIKSCRAPNFLRYTLFFFYSWCWNSWIYFCFIILFYYDDIRCINTGRYINQWMFHDLWSLFIFHPISN